MSLPIVCLEGFELSGGSSEMKCNADGEWTTSATCTPIGKIDMVLVILFNDFFKVFLRILVL